MLVTFPIQHINLPLLGSGTFARVYSYEDRALKVQNEKAACAQNELRHQKTLTSFQHHYIIRTYDTFNQGGVVYTVMERGYTDLFEYVLKNGPMHECEWMYTYYCLSSALMHLHENNLVHGDVKPENAMKMTDGRVTLCDFGFITEANTKDPHTVICGTKNYLPPEKAILLDIPILTNDTLQNALLLDLKKCDIWSFGMTMFALATLRLPANKHVIKETFEAHSKLHFTGEPSCCDVYHHIFGCDVYTYLRQTLMWNPEQRSFATVFHKPDTISSKN